MGSSCGFVFVFCVLVVTEVDVRIIDLPSHSMSTLFAQDFMEFSLCNGTFLSSASFIASILCTIPLRLYKDVLATYHGDTRSRKAASRSTLDVIDSYNIRVVLISHSIFLLTIFEAQPTSIVTNLQVAMKRGISE